MWSALQIYAYTNKHISDGSAIELALEAADYRYVSHEMDSLGGCVCNSGGHIITYLKNISN